MKLRIIVASLAALLAWLPRARRRARTWASSRSRTPARRPRRRISSAASPRSTTSSIRSQREPFSARRRRIPTSRSRTGARRCRTTMRSGTSRIAVAARAALAKLGATPEARAAKAKTPREQAYLDAVEILFGEGDEERSRPALCARDGAAAREVSRRRRRDLLLRARAAGHVERRPRRADVHARRGAHGRSVRAQSAASRRRALPDPFGRRLRARAARAAGRQCVREDRAGFAARAAHDFAYLSRARHVGRDGRGQRTDHSA